MRVTRYSVEGIVIRIREAEVATLVEEPSITNRVRVCFDETVF